MTAPKQGCQRTFMTHMIFSVEPSLWDRLLGSSLVSQVICSSRVLQPLVPTQAGQAVYGVYLLCFFS